MSETAGEVLQTLDEELQGICRAYEKVCQKKGGRVRGKG
jgi:hypothetical protein